MEKDFITLHKQHKGMNNALCFCISKGLVRINVLKISKELILAVVFFSTIIVTAQNRIVVAKENLTPTDNHFPEETNTHINRTSFETNSINYVSPPPVISIVQNGSASSCSPTVQLCSNSGSSLYALAAFPFSANSIAKYTTNFTNHTLVKDNAFTGPIGLTVNYGIDRNPLTGIVYFISGQGQGSERRLYTINLATNAIVNRGPVIATTGSNQVQDFTFDNSGNMYATFQGGIIQKINYNSAALTPTPFVTGLPTGGVGITFDFDANRLLYATGAFADKKIYQISSTGTISLLFNLNTSILVTSQAIEYVGNNICYVASSDSNDLIYRINLITQQVDIVLTNTNFSPNIKDLMYIPLSLQWSGPSGNIGTTTCINVSPTVATTYNLTATNEYGVSATASRTVTIGPCIYSIVNLKLFIQGYYRTTGIDANKMVRVKDNQLLLEQPTSTDVEIITIELHNATAPWATVATTTAMLKTDGTAVCLFPAITGSYYIAVKTRNAVQTWSKLPQSIGTTPLTYDFSTAASNAFGDNMINLGNNVFGFYSGDIEGAKDDEINPIDYSVWEADANNFLFGIYSTDLNGDGEVNPSDYSIWEPNATSFVFALYPQ